MKFRSVSPSVTDTTQTVTAPKRFALKVALWLLDSPRLGQSRNVKHFAGRLLKQPAREGVVAAQSRLGQLMCRECGNARDRRIGHDLLRSAARAGDRRAQSELRQVED
ncbi:sel1 repeat family protein [Pseudomonas sp. W2Jun17]|uniref:sel1 repeat family protein n=1 Tax=Pseudomonas sp. W2Jun17 TaxID=1553460 RepID=UPI0020039C73|nr:sel1 repeat family protein [Pseudomonas sp. W2Jun17]MCK3850734.1 sel1 repeat family protein [Pseudomonas sp. W2Jun17]